MKQALLLALLLLAPIQARAQSWVQVPPQTTWNFYDCWFDPAAPSRGFITGWRMVAWDQVSFLYSTTDGGATLVPHDVYQGGFFLASQAVTFTSSSVGYLGGSGVLKTYDSGQTWTFSMDFNQANGKLTDICFASPDSGFTVGEGWYGPTAMFFKTVNAGSTWTQHDPPMGQSTGLTCLERPSRHALYAGAISDPGLRTLYKSTNDGNSWVSLPFFTSIHCLCFSSDGTGCAATSAGIYRTTNGGSTWSQVLAAAGAVQCVEIHGGSGFAVTSSGSIYHTTDDGITWAQMLSPVEGSASLYDVCLLSSQYAIAVGSGGTVLRYGNAGAVDPGAGPGIPGAGISLEIAPNPIRLAGTVAFSTASSGPVSLRLFDASGRAVRHILEDALAPGEHKASLSAAGLPSGVYFCRLSAGGGTTTRKILIE